jgi:poly(hydroxyalkanoate) granule-associated protein
MVDRAKKLIPDFIKDQAKNMKEPLGRIEKALENARERLNANVDKIDTTEVRKYYDELLDWIRTTRTEIEHFFSTRLEKTLSTLRLPSRDEVESLKKQVASLSKTVSAMKKTASPKKAPKKMPAKKAKK